MDFTPTTDTIALLTLAASLLVAVLELRSQRRERARQYKAEAAAHNQTLAADADFFALIEKARSGADLEPAERARYHHHLLAVLQYYASNVDLIADKRGRPRTDGGYGRLLRTALDCTAARDFWKRNEEVFEMKFRKTITQLLKADMRPATIYADVIEAERSPEA